ncbi:hypothetical protein M514_01435 [Trichuris suis]|uniref:Unspecific monooxygenase n=1 Tax=Trichuris suis TaxID=68888 RepID=A0A085N7R8_9BILA|nr:hypothetical protein M513_01435 [Trichuris suis]KFD65514.1 hypothetical protein M514_01435 [Trichuris suis]
MFLLLPLVLFVDVNRSIIPYSELLIILSIALLVHRVRKSNSTLHTRGPLALPYLGHYLDLQREPYELARRISAQYGPLVELRFGPSKVIVLNDWDTIRTTLASNEFSDRPAWLSMQLQNEAYGRFAFRPYGKDWKHLRRSTVAAITLLRNQSLMQTQQYCHQAIEELLATLRSTEGQPVDPSSLMFDCFVHVVGKLIFGPENFDHRDPQLQEIFCSTPEMDGMFRIGCLTDCFPWMKLLRRKTIADIRRVNAKFDNFVIQKVDDRIGRCSTDVACMVDALSCVAHKEQPTTESDINFTCYAAMDAFGAGLFTSIANAKWSLLLLAKYPCMQKRLRSEIIEHVGCQEFVSMENRASLKYAEAFMNEVLRFATVLPLAIPHATINETFLLNYHCPKSTPVLANLWAAHRDPTVFSNPDEFNPDRFLDNNGCLDRKLLSRVRCHSDNPQEINASIA